VGALLNGVPVSFTLHRSKKLPIGWNIIGTSGPKALIVWTATSRNYKPRKRKRRKNMPAKNSAASAADGAPFGLGQKGDDQNARSDDARQD
jgi:hypothetical protein